VTSFRNIGSVLYKKGDLDGALAQYRRALTIEEEKAPNLLTIAISYNNVGLVLSDKGDLDVLIWSAIVCSKSGRLQDYGLLVYILLGGCGLLWRSHVFCLVLMTWSVVPRVVLVDSHSARDPDQQDGALEQYRCGLTIEEENAPDSLNVATSFSNIGPVLYKKGDLDGALAQYCRALTIEEEKAPNSLTIAISYNKVGLVLSDKGDLDGALEQCRCALASVSLST
jgi:tetratricopeptide (TPR) repeat protein